VEKIILNTTKTSRILNIVLLSAAGIIIALLIIGTIYALVRPADSQPLFSLGNSPARQQLGSTNDDIRVFTGLGQLRIPLSNSSLLLLSINFPYNTNDILFTEELAAKINDLKTIAADYFSSLSASSLIRIDEDAAKREILRRFNNNLRLGRISDLYFSDMLVID